jgi:hypothetical protein
MVEKAGWMDDYPSILLTRLLSNTINNWQRVTGVSPWGSSCLFLLYNCPLIARMSIPVKGIGQNKAAIFLLTGKLLN